MSENTIPNGNSAEEVAEVFQAQFDALEIPSNIDPRLLAIWVEREQAEIDHKKEKYIKPPRQTGRRLSCLFSAYIGIAVMCLSIILGIIQHKEPTAILSMTCIVFLIYSFIGFIVGTIAEWCVADSVETLLRDIVKRSQAAAEGSRLTQAISLLGDAADDILDGRR